MKAQPGNGTLTDEELLKFIGAHIKSVWAVEQMLVLTRDPVRAWELGELVRETRSSRTAVGASPATNAMSPSSRSASA